MMCWPPSSSDRLVPQRPLPPYSYVPGRWPHPLRDMAGHSYGKEIVVGEFDAEHWARCEAYLFGIDLFNAGYYWEAHESWEAVWNAVGRQGPVANVLKGLIKLAAAGVKAREGRAIGIRRHAARAGQLFADVQRTHNQLLGLRMGDLISFAHQLPGDADSIVNIDDDRVIRLWRFTLKPHG